MEQQEKQINWAQAINVLIQVAHLAQNKGILSFDDSAIVGRSIKILEEQLKDIENQARKEIEETESSKDSKEKKGPS